MLWLCLSTWLKSSSSFNMIDKQASLCTLIVSCSDYWLHSYHYLGRARSYASHGPDVFFSTQTTTNYLKWYPINCQKNHLKIWQKQSIKLGRAGVEPAISPWGVPMKNCRGYYIRAARLNHLATVPGNSTNILTWIAIRQQSFIEHDNQNKSIA